LAFLLGDLARQADAELRGDANCAVVRIDTLQDAAAGSISFLANRKYRKHLASTKASAVIVSTDLADQCPVHALISDNPYLAYARVAEIMNPTPSAAPGVHPSAVVADSARVHVDASVGPCAVIGDHVEVASGVIIGPGCVLETGCRVGQGTKLVANVTLCHETEIGSEVLIHPGAVIGSDGFGLASNEQGVWEKVPQLGRVRIGNRVEVGANTTIDRGAVRDTVIDDGVKLDNQIQVAHNVVIGENSAVAGCAGISGSTTIGRNCTIGGGVGLAGHLEIGDNVHFSGQTLVTRSFKEPGHYSGNLPAVSNREWRKTVARIRRLDDMMRRLKKLEKELLSRTAATWIE